MIIYKIDKLAKTAASDSEFKSVEKKVKDCSEDIKELKKKIKEISSDHKSFDSIIEKIEKKLEMLNIGKRLFTQPQSNLTSLQRKVERFERVEMEWDNFKEDMNKDIRDAVERHLKKKFN